LKSKLTIKIGAALLLFIFVCVVTAWAGGEIPADSDAGRWYSIVPALLAIVLAFLTHRVFLSLGLAILVGGLLMEVPSAPVHLNSYGKGILTAAGFSLDAIIDKDNLQILAFFPPMFSMIAVLVASGGFRGILDWLSRWIRGRKSVQAITALVGLLYFIDDYSNTLIVGSMMRPVTDRYRISREKLAFLVDATSAPITGLAVIDHCSPISDTTIISSHASFCDLMQHVRTQLPYSLLVAVLALVCGYIPSALGLSWSGCILLAGCVMAGFFATLSYWQKKRTV